MGQDHKREIEKIIGKMGCPKDFRCYKAGFENLCKAEDIGIESFLKCLEKNPQECRFSLSLGAIYLCQCPLRAYIVKKLKK